MTPSLSNHAVFVEAPGRLHFGVLDLRGGLGRWFGGIGTAAPAPTLLISAYPSDTVEVSGDDADRAAGFAREFLTYHGLEAGVRLFLHRTLPAHSGLGSGTQLALAIARAMAELYDIKADASGLARAVGRARRSAIGTWTFSGGGLVLEGGRRRDGNGVAPLLARIPFPPTWRCIVVIPKATPGISGADETAAFDEIPQPSERDVEHVSHLVLMALLPALAEADLATFGAALNRIQTTTGQWFASVQGGPFAIGASEELVRRMSELGAIGVGQSSWGPAVYGIVEGDEAATRLADRIRTTLNGAGSVYSGPFPTSGARIWRTQARALTEVHAWTRSGH